MIKRIGLLLAAVLLFAVISGCATEIPTENNTQENHKDININFESVTHKRSDVSSRTYKALAATYNGAAYEIEEVCINTEAEGKQIIQSINADIIEVMSFLEGFEVDTPTVLVVTKDILDGKDLIHSYHYDNTVITTIEHVNNKEYIHALIGAMLSNNSPWLNYGIAGQFNNRVVNEDEIKTYLSTDNNIEELDFFGARFYETVADNNPIKMISVTEAFVDYYITAYGKDVFLNIITSESMSDLVKEKNEWLSHLGLEQNYSNENSIVFQNFELSQYPNYDFVIHTPYAIYRIKMNVGENYVLSSIDNLKYFLTKNILAMQEVKTFLSNKISDKDLIEFDVIPLYNINEGEYRLDGHADPYNDIIVIHVPLLEYAHIHEYVHVITPIKKDSSLDHDIYEEYRYFVEGIACYITSSVNNEYSCDVTNFNTYENNNPYQVLTKNIIESDADGTHIFGNVSEFTRAFERSYSDYYMSHATDFTEFSDFSMKIYSDAYSYARFVMMEQDPTKEVFDYAVYESFVGYLVDEYSLEQAIQALDNYNNIEAIFGKSFSELHSDWRDYLYKSL